MAFSFKDELIAIFYPPVCAHCQCTLPKRIPLFCPTCLEQISLIETQQRCWTCFGELYKGRCDRCIHRPVVIHRQFAACEAMGPAKTLLQAITQGKRECIPAAASLMAYQWLEQKMPLPDLLVPFPVSFWQKQQRGFDANLFLAEELGKIFSIPVLPVLKRKWDKEHFLTQGEFQICFDVAEKKREQLCDKHLLLIAPRLDDDLFRRAGSELRTYFPTRVDGLAFAIL